MKRHKDLTVCFATNTKKTRTGLNEQILQNFIRNLSEVVKDVPPQNIWNYDESKLSDNPEQKKVVTKREIKYPETIRNIQKNQNIFDLL